MIPYEYPDIFTGTAVQKELLITDGTVTVTDDEYTVSGETIKFETGDFELESFELSQSLMSEMQFTYGCCETGKVRFIVRKHYVNSIKGVELKVYIIPDHDASKMLQLGVFKVNEDKQSDNYNVHNITAYDAMYDILNEDVTDWYNDILEDETSSVTLATFRTSFISFFGLTTESASEPLYNDDLVLKRTIEKDQISGAEIIKAICEINGCFGIINNVGQFRYKGLPPSIIHDASTLELDVSDYMDIQFEETSFKAIKAVKIVNDGVSVTSSQTATGNYNTYTIAYNPLIANYSQADLQSLADDLCDLMLNHSYLPCSINAIGNPVHEVGDCLEVNTKYGYSILTYIFERTLKGIQALRDTYRSNGVEYLTESLNKQSTQTKALASQVSQMAQGGGGGSTSDINFPEIIRNIGFRLLDEPSNVSVQYNQGAEYTFGYTGNIQTFTAPESGNYLLEAWGASGGHTDPFPTGFAIHSLGGYSRGLISLSQNDTIYIYVGGKGEKPAADSQTKAGGTNGGGSGGKGYYANYMCGGGGGGATHIATANRGVLANYNEHRDEIIMVAGGGGGTAGGSWGGESYPEGAQCGGGFEGKNGYTTSNATVYPYGGTQNSGYQFGQGENGGDGQWGSGAGEGRGGGGGGWFGGRARGNTSGDGTNAGGGGGSGYINTSVLTDAYMGGYYVSTSSSTATKTISFTEYSDTPQTDKAKEGNGFAKITKITNGEGVYIKWTDPVDIATNEPCPATWAGTVVVRNENHAPLNRWDGDLIVDSTTRDEYSVTPLVDNTVQQGHGYYYGIFPYDTKGDYRYTKVVRAVVAEIPIPRIEGLLAGTTSISVSYSADSSYTYDYLTLVYKKNSAPASKTDGTTVSLSASSTSMTINGLDEQTTYYFKIFAQVTGASVELESNTESATTGVIPIYDLVGKGDIIIVRDTETHGTYGNVTDSNWHTFERTLDNPMNVQYLELYGLLGEIQLKDIMLTINGVATALEDIIETPDLTHYKSTSQWNFRSLAEYFDTDYNLVELPLSESRVPTKSGNVYTYAYKPYNADTYYDLKLKQSYKVSKLSMAIRIDIIDNLIDPYYLRGGIRIRAIEQVN